MVGVSPDSAKSHRNFRSRKGIGITLLSDPEHEVLEKYGVWQRKKMAGREYYGVVRSTYVIDPEGRIAWGQEKVKVKGHAAQVLAWLQAAAGS